MSELGTRNTSRHHVEQVMGTAVSIDIRDADVPDEAIDDVVTWLHHVDSTFSTHKLDSPISSMGRGELSFENATDEIREVLRLCETVSRETNGVFNVFEVPAPNGTRFDPSGLVKGWSIERAAAILEDRGCHNFCINAGGDIVLRGRQQGSKPWLVGIRHPEEPDVLALVIRGTDRLAVASSANYERGAHIIDLRTARPAEALVAATVVGPDLTLADAYATAVFVLGLDGLDWIQHREGYDAYVITDNKQTHWTPGFTAYRTEQCLS